MIAFAARSLDPLTVLLYATLALSALPAKGQITTGQTISGAPFTLRGTINADSGTVTLWPVGDSDSNPIKPFHQDASVLHGRFTLSGTLPYPCGFLLWYTRDSVRTYVTGYFLLDTGDQTIICNVDSIREIPSISNNSMKEYRESYQPFMQPVEDGYTKYRAIEDSLRIVYHNKVPGNLMAKLLTYRDSLGAWNNRVLEQYARAHPRSFIPLWSLIERFGSGYKTVYDSIYAQFSTEIQTTYTGKTLGITLQRTRTTGLGNLFPTLGLLTEQNTPITFPPLRHQSKYTLVDFWFAHCGACIGEFPQLKKIYAAYKDQGLDIVGISTDDTPQIPAWKKVIKSNALPWTQFLDKGAVSAKRLSISAYPTNYLLDENGKIIAKNIYPDQLVKFLLSQGLAPKSQMTFDNHHR